MNILEIHPDGKSCMVKMTTESKENNEVYGIRLKRIMMTYFMGLDI